MDRLFNAMMRFSFLLISVLFSGCNLAPFPTPTIPTLTPVDTATATEIEDWQTLIPGLEQRLYTTETGYFFEAVRIDPTYYTFRVHYRPGDPLEIDEWYEALPGAALIVNANFFALDNTIQGLLISDGVVYGRAFTDRGGTFFVQNGVPGIQSNIQQPYRSEAYEQAIQAFPMLVFNGAAAYSNNRDIGPTRRTIIGQDRQGRVIVMVTPGFGPGLYLLSQYLPTTDIGFVNAFNLDGGGSTMMYRAPDNYTLSSFDAVPAVLAVYLR